MEISRIDDLLQVTEQAYSRIPQAYCVVVIEIANDRRTEANPRGIDVLETDKPEMHRVIGRHPCIDEVIAAIDSGKYVGSDLVRRRR
ncbi:hypothetical protein DID97_17385 [Burkholderia sp. Bp8977]|nr:hypothetical protein DID97_17385 [Burkholderia sp. Bp8977]